VLYEKCVEYFFLKLVNYVRNVTQVNRETLPYSYIEYSWVYDGHSYAEL